MNIVHETPEEKLQTTNYVYPRKFHPIINLSTATPTKSHLIIQRIAKLKYKINAMCFL